MISKPIGFREIWSGSSWTWVIFLNFLSDCFWAFQSIMSPTTLGLGNFRTEKGFLAESTFLVSCRLSLSISWAAEAGNPLKQMLGSKCSFLFCFIWYFCFVGLFRLIKTSAQLESLPMFDPFVGDFLGSPQIDMFWMWPPQKPWHKGWSIYQKEVRDQNRYRPNRAAEEMRPKQGHFKDFAKNILKIWPNISCNFIRWRRWRSKQIGGRLRSKQQRNMSNRCDPTTTLCCGH